MDKSKLIIYNIINSMRKKYKCFVSEKHLQFAFATEASKIIKNSKIYPEFVFADFGGKHIDLVVQVGKYRVGFEFKYIVSYCEGDYDGLHIKLRNQSALPVRRYNCLSDIERLEKLKENNNINEGYFCLMTNEKQLWKKSITRKDTTDKNLRFENGISHGRKFWSKNASIGTKNGKNKAINIKNDYTVRFIDFLDLCDFGFKGNTTFKLLLIKVK